MTHSCHLISRLPLKDVKSSFCHPHTFLKQLRGGELFAYHVTSPLKLSVGTECTLVHCSLYTGCICRVLTPRELRNQVVNLHCFATGHESGSARATNAHRCTYLLQVTASLIALAGERAILYDSGATITSQRSVGRSPRKPFLNHGEAQAEAEAAPVREDSFPRSGLETRVCC